MSVHKWRRRPTKYFGEVFVPFAHIEIATCDGRFQAFALQVDSGAVVSLLRRSVADLLGVSLESGDRVNLRSVFGAETVAYVHRLQTRFAENIAYPVPFAIADTESVPNLLGRLDVFDHLQIDFDGTLGETRITAPWLKPDQRLIWDELLKAERHILDRWSDVDLPSPANDVGRHFINRGGQLLATAAGLLKLHREYEGPMVIRAMFELALQFEYLMRDPQSRAQQYLDYAHITKYRYFRAVASHPTGPISQAIASSPMRAAGEIRNEEEYRRVLERFLRPKGKQPWSNWYCKSIRDLADELGWAGEYRVLYAIGSSWAHADPVHTDAHSPFGQGSPDVVYVVCLHYYARMLLRVSEQLILTDTEYKLLKALAQEVS